MKKLFKSKVFLIIFGVFILAQGTWSILSIRHQVQRIPSGLQRQFGVASEKLKNSPPGILRSQTFLQDLKTIGVSSAPTDQQQALKQYIDAQEASLSDMAAVRDEGLSDRTLAEAAQNLAKSFHQ